MSLSPRLSYRLILSASFVLTAPFAALSAQTAQDAPTPPVTPGQVAEEITQSQQANREQAELAAKQLDQNAANQAEYNARRASYEAQMRLYQHNVDDRAQAQEQYDALKALYDRVYKQWEADVAACNAGERSRCGPPPPKQP